jgi:hypothetical protein
VLLDAGGKFEAVVVGIVEEELNGGGVPVAAAGRLAFLAPGADFGVIEA